MSFKDFQGLSEKWNTAAEYIAVYPNVLLGVHRDHFFAILLEPVKVDQTIDRIELYYAADPEEQPELSCNDTASAPVNTRERKKLERICLGGPVGIFPAPHYRQARLELTNHGMVRYALKSAYLRGPIGMGLRM